MHDELTPRDWLIRTLPLLPLVVAGLIILWFIEPADEVVPPPVDLTEITAETPQELAMVFAERDYQWPPEGTVPPLSLSHFPDGMAELGVDERKSLFFRSLLPLVLAENQRIEEKRRAFLPIHDRLNQDRDAELSEEEAILLDHLSQRYRIDGDLRDTSERERLLRRLDIVPPSLTLAQAANESGWGSSRFTQEANNLFGEWTWDESQGLMPQRRVEGATHFVRIFTNLRGSVRSYIHNLNTGHAYTALRQTRAQLRAGGQTPDGLRLAEGLERYSERGQAYIREVQSMIRQNQLEDLPQDLELEQPE
ncbi:Bax protein [Natronospira proteinivora]|uniref:Bax protein n=1 Tax=Natronospira proteinivora TaxID=1807133 RepID=A0ABT1G535_9GAMM|nr:glucosaminidase domain-containing protein [Natronospira proteinivora]MCP1726391.1 Bax protein [Natronospira proteinivora]